MDVTVFVFLAVALLAVAPTPQPSAPPLREIGHVRATVVCSALDQPIRKALLGVLSNDNEVTRGREELDKMAHDQVRRARGSLRFDRNAIDETVRKIVEQSKDVEKALGDTKSLPVEGAEGYAEIENVKRQLELVLSDQNDAVNALEGTVETERLGEMQKEGLDALHGAVSADQAPIPTLAVALAEDDELTSYLGYAGVDPLAQQGSNPIASAPDGLVANTVYERLSELVLLEQRASRADFDPAKGVIGGLWAKCLLPSPLQTAQPGSTPLPR
jgi:hypothetical protein